MTPRYMLDTDMCSYIIRGPSDAMRERIRAHADNLVVSAITEAELRYGARKRGSSRISMAIDFFLELVEVIPWRGSAARRFAEIRCALEAAGIPIGNMDMLIGASALAENCRVVTHNTAHFSRIPGLEIEDWT